MIIPKIIKKTPFKVAKFKCSIKTKYQTIIVKIKFISLTTGTIKVN